MCLSSPTLSPAWGAAGLQACQEVEEAGPDARGNSRAHALTNKGHGQAGQAVASLHGPLTHLQDSLSQCGYYVQKNTLTDLLRHVSHGCPQIQSS